MTDRRQPDPDEGRHRVFWVGLVLALLGGQILMLFVMVYLATADGSFAVEPDYYQKGLNWDREAAQLQQNGRLGWTLDLRVDEQASVVGERAIVGTLRDRVGQPLDGAAVELVCFPHARGSDRSEFSLSPRGEGRYEATARVQRAGLWEFRFVVQRGPERFTSTQRITVGGQRGSQR